MKRRQILLLLPFLVAALLPSRPAHADSDLHPPIVLYDADGEEALETGRAVSPSETCGACHDTTYISGHSYHVAVGFDETFAPGSVEGLLPWSFSPGTFGRWDLLRYRRVTIPGEQAFDLGVADWIRLYGARHAGGGPAYWSRTGARLTARAHSKVIDPETHVLDPDTRRAVPWDWAASGAVEMNCFLCHLKQPDNAARVEALQRGAFQWAATATLAQTGLVKPNADGGWSYQRSRFTAAGEVPRDRLRIVDPQSTNCGLCHGVVYDGKEPLALDLSDLPWETASKGQVYSAQPIRDSALNLAGKDGLAHAWDVHAARLVACADCHTSLNNPVFFSEAERSRPRHLSYDARRPSIGEFLTRPSHHFAKGESAQGTTARRLDGTMRRCEDCHDALAIHEEWLPNPRRHLRTLLCETCHVPAVHAPARRQYDWTVLTPERGPRVELRGVEGSIDDPATLIEGFRPVILPRRQLDGLIRHGPHNLCTGWFWMGGDPLRPVPVDRLEAAYFAPDPGGGYRPEIVTALDENGDGSIQRGELRLDTEAKVAAVTERLVAVGVVRPHIKGCLQPYSLHHGVVPGRVATRRCETCHARDSRLTEPFLLSSYVPAGATATLVGDSNVELGGRLERTEDGGLAYVPIPTASGRYVIGHDRAGWIDIVGLLLVFGTLAGVVLHAALRGRYARLARREEATR